MNRGQVKRLGITLAFVVGVPAPYFGTVGIAYAAGVPADSAWALGVTGYVAAAVLLLVSVGMWGLFRWIKDGE